MVDYLIGLKLRTTTAAYRQNIIIYTRITWLWLEFSPFPRMQLVAKLKVGTRKGGVSLTQNDDNDRDSDHDYPPGN